MSKPRRMRITEKQVAIVLAAVADLECWDAEHPTVECNAEGWRFIATPAGAMPEPSAALLKRVKQLLARNFEGGRANV